MKRLRGRLVVLLAAAVGYGLGWAQPFVMRPALVLGQDAVSDPASREARVSLDDVGGRVISIRPAGDSDTILFVLYPGGLVRPQAYEWLGRALAEHGVQTVIPEFPADLAVTGRDRAAALIEHYARSRRVVIGGHSLGAAMAADFAAAHPKGLQGLILLAGYPPDSADLSRSPMGVLSVTAELDGVMKPQAAAQAERLLPPETRKVVITGAVHSFFGRYGPQAGDGLPTVQRADAEREIVQAISAYLAGLG